MSTTNGGERSLIDLIGSPSNQNAHPAHGAGGAERQDQPEYAVEPGRAAALAQVMNGPGDWESDLRAAQEKVIRP